jgi:hypothetical protein
MLCLPNRAGKKCIFGEHFSENGNEDILLSLDSGVLDTGPLMFFIRD